jgi:hypothetical protein
MPENHGFLSLISLADNFRIVNSGEVFGLWTISRSSPPGEFIGLLRTEIIQRLFADNARAAALNHKPSWDIKEGYGDAKAVSFADHLDTPSKRSYVMKDLCERWRDEGLFPNVIGPKKWRGEAYPVYRDPFGERIINQTGAAERGIKELTIGEEEDVQAKSCANYAFSMERSACSLFGVVTYGIHMTIYEEPQDGPVRIWVPRRARTKQTSGYLQRSIVPLLKNIFEQVAWLSR